jgi:hypothetical protein
METETKPTPTHPDTDLPEREVQVSDLLRTDAGHAVTDLVRMPTSISSPHCSKCGGERDRGSDKPYCRRCHNDYQKRWQADQRKLLRMIKSSGLNFSD